MRLYLVKRTEGASYDEYDAHVVRAENEQQARKLCHAEGACDPEGVWLDPQQTTCEELSTIGGAAVLLSSFNAG